MPSNTDTDFDPFAGSSGLADDLEVTFTETRFMVDPQYSDSDTGELIPIFAADLVTDQSDVGNNGVLENQFFSIGKGWVIEDDGARVVRAEGKKGGFNHSSYLQQIVARCLELDEKTMRDRYEDTGFSPQTAAFWEGFRCHMVQEEYTTGGFKGVEKKVRSHLMPDEVYGWDDAEAKPAKPAAKKAVAKPAPAKKAATAKPTAKPKPAVKEEPVEETPAEPTGELSEYQTARAQVDAEIVAAIEAIAAEADTDADFIDRCYAEVDGLADDDNAMYLVDNVDADDSIWQIALAEATAAAEG